MIDNPAELVPNPTSLITLASVLLLVVLTAYRARRRAKRYPNLPHGPGCWPVIGAAHHLDGHRVQFAGLTALRETYGDVFSFKMGSLDCIVLNRFEDIQEAFRAGRDDLDGRPDFKRFINLFSGDKDNALAFCDYSAVQDLRRRLLRPHTLPYSGAPATVRLERFVEEEVAAVLADLGGKVAAAGDDVFGVEVDIKMTILKACANIFNRYFCSSSSRFDYASEPFTEYVSDFDQVFHEVNQSRLADIVPWLYVTAWGKVREAKFHAAKVRQFVISELINPNLAPNKSVSEDEGVETLLTQLAPFLGGEDDAEGAGLTKDTALYALEDILGGSCAVGCIALRMVKDIAKHPEVQSKLVSELTSAAAASPSSTPAHSLSKAHLLHWTRAAAAETIRLTCSPIVPHRATRDTKIAGYDVPKDTIILANNHALNFTGPNWGADPTAYTPSHHISPDTGRYQKPHNHFPFSLGKRSCLGFRMVENISLSLVAALVGAFEMSMREGSPLEGMPMGMLAVPLAPFEVVLKARRNV